MSKCIKKQAPTTCCPRETHFKYKDTSGLKAEGRKKMHHDNTNQKEVGMANFNQEIA